MPSTKNTPEDFNPDYIHDTFDDDTSVTSDYSSTTDTTVADLSHQRRKGRQLYYTSNIMGGNIRNAITGAPYPEKVGTKESLRYFRITDSSGTCNSAGERLRRNEETNREPNHLYYNGPNEAISHGWDVSAESIEAWRHKQISLFPDGRLNERVYAQMFPTPDHTPGLGPMVSHKHTKYPAKTCRSRLGFHSPCHT